MKNLIYPILHYSLFALLISCSSPEKGFKPQRQALVEAVYASGSIQPKNQYQVYSAREGLLAEKMVEEGDTIRRGQILFMIDGQEQDFLQRNSRDVYDMAQYNYKRNSPILQELAISVENARVKMYNDSINYLRYKNLIANRATSQADYDRASLNYETSKNEYQLQKQKYLKTQDQLSLDLKNAQSQYQVNTTRNSDYSIESKMDGLVYEVYKEIGETVRRNDPIALLGSPKHLYLQLSVDELDINRVKKGQKVLVKIDLFPDKIFEAQVDKIYRMMDSQDQSFRVDAEFTKPFENNYVGLNVEANIIIRRKKDALVISKTLLVHKDSVKIRKKGKVQTIPVKTGIETLDQVEVISGLDTSDVLVQP